MSKLYRKHIKRFAPWTGEKQAAEMRKQLKKKKSPEHSSLCEETSDLSLLCDDCLKAVLDSMEETK